MQNCYLKLLRGRRICSKCLDYPAHRQWDTMKPHAASVRSSLYWYGVIRQYIYSSHGKENSMSTTFNPYALVVMVTLINTTEDMMEDENTPLDWKIHIEHVTRSCWCLRRFTSYSISSTIYFSIDGWLWIGDILYLFWVFFPIEKKVHLEKFGSAAVVVTFVCCCWFAFCFCFVLVFSVRLCNHEPFIHCQSEYYINGDSIP